MEANRPIRIHSFPTHILVCGLPHTKYDLAYEVEGREGSGDFAFYESLGAELATRDEVYRVLLHISETRVGGGKRLIWQISHIDAVSTVAAYILHSLMVNDYITYKGSRFHQWNTQVVGTTANLAKVPRILLSAFHLQITFDESGFRRKGLSVYFLQAGKSGSIKIGRTYNLAARFVSLQTGSSDELRLLAFINCREADPAEVEAVMHNKFQQYRLQGEWFSRPWNCWTSSVDLARTARLRCKVGR